MVPSPRLALRATRLGRGPLGALRWVQDWPREQSLGTHVDFSHLAATPPGLTVTVDCEVIAVEGRKVTFRAAAHDGHDLISEGTHERVVIDAARFADRVARKKPPQRPSGQ